MLSLKRKSWGALVTIWLLLCLSSQTILGQGSNAGEEPEPLPKVPSSLIREVSPYTSMSSYGLAGWQPSRREIWAKAITGSYLGIASVGAPGDSPQVGALFPANTYDVYYSPNGKSAVYVKDTDGNEQFQVYAYDPSNRKASLLSDGKSRNTEPVWSNASDWVIYSSNRRNGTDTDLYVAKPFEPNTTKLLAQDKGYLKVFDWSPDDRQALFYNWLSANESYLYTVDVASGEKTLLTPQIGTEKVAYDYAQFSADGKGVYLTTDRDSEFLRLAYMDLATKKVTYLSESIKWNIDLFGLSPDRKTLAFVSNEDGVSRLRLLATATNKERPVTWPRVGVISNLRWHNNRFPRVNDDPTPAVVALLPKEFVQDRKRFGAIRAGNQQNVSERNIVPGICGAIDSKSLVVSSRRGDHAEPAVVINVTRAESSARELAH